MIIYYTVIKIFSWDQIHFSGHFILLSLEICASHVTARDGEVEVMQFTRHSPHSLPETARALRLGISTPKPRR